MTLAIFGGGPRAELPALPKRTPTVNPRAEAGNRHGHRAEPRPCVVCGIEHRPRLDHVALGQGRACSPRCRGREQRALTVDRVSAVLLGVLRSDAQSVSALCKIARVDRHTARRALDALLVDRLAQRIEGGPTGRWRLP